MTGTPTPRPPVALYIHVPFCVSLCPYCDFVVIAGSAARGPRSRIAQFLDALLVEIDLRADALDRRFGEPGTRRRPPLSTVYLGGGTPSLVPPDEIERILTRVRERFGVAKDAEITIEVEPRARRAGRPGGPAPRRRHAHLVRCPVLRRRRAAQARAAPSGAPRGRRRWRRTGGGHRVDQRRPALRHPGHRPADLDDDARCGTRARARPPLAVCAVARRPRRRRPDRTDRRPPPDHQGRAALA